MTKSKTGLKITGGHGGIAPSLPGGLRLRSDGMSVHCPYCASSAVFSSSEAIYGRNLGMMWICANYPFCDAYVCAHETGEPMGQLANKELREWRQAVHRRFDRLWRSGSMSRNEAYRWLRQKMKLPKAECHIGQFDVEKCQEAIEILKGGDA